MGFLKTASRLVCSAVLAGAASFGATGCVREYVMIQTGVYPEPMLYEDALSWTREASASVNTMHDFDSAREGSYGQIGTLEGMHKLVPDDENGLLLLTKAWAGMSYAFIDDEREDALDRKDEQLAAYQEARTRAGFQRARFYGEELVGLHAKGFKESLRNADTFRAWLQANYADKDRVEELLWLGFSIVGRIAFDLDNPQAVSELWVGVEILEYVVKLDDTFENGNAHTMLGAYYARSAQSELDVAKQHFDRAMAIHGGRLLTTKLSIAQRYYCMKRDKKNYFETLQQVLDAGDVMPEQRLSNVIAKRRARRYLDNKYWQEDCAFEG